MRKMTVKNVGPIKEALLELKKVNILIGPQSTGKSTLAKIACYCTWVEKEIFMSQHTDDFKEEGVFLAVLASYHNLKGYFNKDSEVHFSSDTMEFGCVNNKFHFTWGDARWRYSRNKTLYIPAERNMMAVIPNWFEISLPDNNTRSFLAEWERVRKSFTREQPLQLLGIAANYYYNTSSRTDQIVLSNGTELEFSNVSSGVQSSTPLLSLVQYYSKEYWASEEYQASFSVKDAKRISELMKNKDLTEKEQRLATYNQMYPQQTALFVEEPELNLYPSTQYELVKKLISLINTRKHSVFITTHSPYVLTTLNNLIYAGELGIEFQEEIEKIVPASEWLLMQEVSAWKIDDNSTIHPLLDTEMKMIRAEELDEISLVINEEFDRMFDVEMARPEQRKERQ